MKKTMPVLLLLLSSIMHGQQAPRLIVRGDDMGYSHAGNLALIKCFKEGIQTSIEVIVPSPWFPEAVQMLAANPTADVGIHLALTSEWDNIKWRPLTTVATLRDSDGYFYPMVYPNKNYPGRSISDNNWSLEDVEKEFRAQIEMALKKIPRISHLSFHMGCHNLSPQVRELTKKLALEYHLSAPTESDGVVQASFDGATTTAAEKIESFIRMLQKLQPGKTYLFVEHPGIDGEELRAVHHIGYEEVAADRQGVTDLYTSEKVKAIIKQKGIQLVSYKQIAH
ncbi:MAG TPA: polysaccharide deacetylase family protein [Chitinophagaceae bacterium]|nr:polysaccharide deacetylase family protein [Chitinophagaceae bacterium]